ncbi:brachyurin-like [Drosophila serrata]|uniref:brachyurin-like n=1 Tax=Drosophila serrata TaxID=7274 RepID=UPI000A1D29C7|nr:brachyurin-like [Drosophila serrata]
MKVTAVLLLALASASAGPLSSLRPVHPRDRTIEQSIESRIVGGNYAYIGQIPYQVGITFDYGSSSGFCGGSIISNEWILTAAHCTDNADSATIYAGSILLNTGVKRTASSQNIKQHSDYNEDSLVNDIALIMLSQALEFGPTIGKVGLPPLTGPYDTYEDQTARVSGWGLPDTNAILQTFFLKYVDVMVISNTDCNLAYPGFIKPSHLCTATNTGKGTCYGDSGGPLTVDNGSTEDTQIGIVSFGSYLGCTAAPSAYTRVSAYQDWIYEKSGV